VPLDNPSAATPASASPLATAGRAIAGQIAYPLVATFARLQTIRFVAAVVWTVLALSFRPSTWSSMVRDVLARQIYFTGVGALGITCVGGLMVGISVIAQAGVWLARFDQSAFFGPLVASVVIQNLGPLLVNFFIIGRSGTAITTELANMAVHHEIEVLDGQGVDPFVYLVVPRVIGVAVSVVCLTVLFVAVALLGGYALGVALQIPALSGSQFSNGIFLSMGLGDMIQFLAKTILPGLVTGAVCCVYGLRVEPVLTAVPQAGTRAVVASVWAMFVLSAIVSLFAVL
jgi:phospholipid/cholesterol/gamma-HCH transport system permease protein